MATSPLARGFLSSPEELIDEARNGRMFILVDDEQRENEGDLVIPAQMATPEAINFMATHGKGLICLAMSKARIDQLALPLMSRHNGTRHETAFTISIEAREGVTTGISAADRARTVSVAIDAGHTEAGVDVSRLAGLNPSAVICEIMREDGTMARMDDLVAFAQRHGLKIGTIRDLIAYRLKKDHLVEQKAEAEFESRWGGTWIAKAFLNKALGTETVALVKGKIDPSKPTLVRMHQLSLFSDALGEANARSGLLAGAMKAIGEEGAGVIVCLDRQAPFSDILNARSGKSAKDMDQLRDYGGGAQILSALGIHDMVLLTNTHHTPVALEGYGLKIVGERPIPTEG
jgi:3,4-dihydroxy 2-butanone 4-phosphate synthase/GTP cyclohydrolase II